MEEKYLTLLGPILLILLICLIYAWKKKTKYSLWIIHLMSAALIGAVSYGTYLAANSNSMAVIADGLYFWSTDFMCFFMLQFAFSYTDYEKKKIPFVRVMEVLIAADGLALLYNYFSGWMYQITSESGSYGISALSTEIFEIPHYLHILFCYLMLVGVIARFGFAMVNTSKIYRGKYLSMMVPLFVAVICNGICVAISFPLDLSVLLYAVLAITICYVALSLTPGKLVETAQMYIAENTDQGMLCYDEKDHCIFINRILKEYAGERLDLITEHYAEVHHKMKENGTDSLRWSEKISSADGNSVSCFSNSYQQLCDKKGKEIGYFYIIYDETEKELKYEQEKYEATHDSLTGLLNRESFFREADAAIQADPGVARYMLVSDIKDFKLVNNLYGEAYANNILKLQADLVRRYQTEGNICGRIGGDKFGMLLQKEKFDRDIFLHAVQEIGDYTKEKKASIHYHIGIYDVTGLAEPAQVLYNRVNFAVSTVHNDLERVFVDYDQEVIAAVLRKREILQEFDEALAEKQFQMYLQPQIARDGQMVGAEALVRWQHPQKGILYPDSFIEILEEANLIHKLDLEIWEQAAAKLAEWKKNGSDHHISINISVKDFYHLDVYQELVRLVKKYQIDPSRLKLEITESAVMTDKKNSFMILSRLKEYGFELELDDFGSGYSSLNMLKDFHVDVLKIDRMFLRETDNAEKSRIILESIMALAKRLDMEIVTEGVENEIQVNSLLGMGCDYFQGYYYDKPITVEAFERKYM